MGQRGLQFHLCCMSYMYNISDIIDDFDFCAIARCLSNIRWTDIIILDVRTGLASAVMWDVTLVLKFSSLQELLSLISCANLRRSFFKLSIFPCSCHQGGDEGLWDVPSKLLLCPHAFRWCKRSFPHSSVHQYSLERCPVSSDSSITTDSCN